MIRYWLKSAVSDFWRHKALTLLSIAGVALGVASTSSVQLINANAITAFRAGIDVVSGPADLTVIGEDPTMDEQVLPIIWKQPGVERAWPSVQATISFRANPPLYLQLIGTDFFSGPSGRWSTADLDVTQALSEPGWVAITPQLSQELGLPKGAPFDVSLGSRRRKLLVGGLLDLQKWVPTASHKMIFMDIAQAQDFFGQRGRISQVDVQLKRGADPLAVARALTSSLPTGLKVLTPSDRESTASALLSAFQLNLTALSLISLFVGVFLIFSTTRAALVRRRREFGLLRSIGASRSQVLVLILSQALLLGILGAALGIPLGILAARFNLHNISDTITNLYLLSEIDHLTVPHSIIVSGVAIGVLSSLLGALLPALDMSRRDTTALLAAFTLHEKVERAALPLFISGLGLLSAIGVWLLLGGIHVRASGFVLAVGILLGFPLITPLVIKLLLGRLSIRRLGLSFGWKSLAVRLGTTAFAVAGLSTAVSMLVGVTLMIGSFRETVSLWINQTLRADIYVTSPSWRRAREAATLADAVVAKLAADPAVEKLDRLRQITVSIDGKRLPLSGVDIPPPMERDRVPLVEGNQDTVLADLSSGKVFIGEPVRRKLGHKMGEFLTMEKQGRRVQIPIAGVYFDYGSDAGSALIDLRTMEKLFGPGELTNIGLHLRSGEDVEAVVDRLKQSTAGSALEIRSNKALKKEVMRIFDQTFAVTRLLEIMSLLVAGCGIALTLLVIAQERISEWALLRSLGASRQQLAAVFLGQGLGIGGLGLMLGFAGGFCLMSILVFMINRAYFGWTIQLHWPGKILLQQIVAILSVAVLSSLIPAWRASRVSAGELSREDL